MRAHLDQRIQDGERGSEAYYLLRILHIIFVAHDRSSEGVCTSNRFSTWSLIHGLTICNTCCCCSPCRALWLCMILLGYMASYIGKHSSMISMTSLGKSFMSG